MKHIKLMYWDALNFGDILGPFIIKELSGENIIHKKTICLKNTNKISNIVQN